MTQSPETRLSLLARLRDGADQEAWREFVEIYRPVVYRTASRRGFQDADAEDLTQQVLASVAGAIDRWEPDPQRARFRTWLHRIAHNAALNALSRAAPDRGSGNSDVHRSLHEHVQQDDDDALLEFEFRRAAFRWAAQQIRSEFQRDTWSAFWRTAVEGQSVDDVAAQLNRTRGAVYAARSRVMRRLRDAVQTVTADDVRDGSDEVDGESVEERE